MIYFAMFLLGLIFIGLSLDARESRKARMCPEFTTGQVVYHLPTRTKALIIRQATPNEISQHYPFFMEPRVAYWVEILYRESKLDISKIPVAQSMLQK